MDVQGISQAQDYSYQGAVNASMQFYAAQQSGSLDSSNSDIPSWRGDSGLGDLPVGGFYLGTSKAPSFNTGMLALCFEIDLSCTCPAD